MQYKSETIGLVTKKNNAYRPQIIGFFMILWLTFFHSIAWGAGSINISMPDSVMVGSTVHLTGTIDDNGPVVDTSLGITITDPANSVYLVNETKSKSDGTFSFDFSLPASVQPGAWQAAVSGGGATASKSFTVTGANCQFSVAPLVAKPNQTVSFNGKMPQGNVAVGITVTAPNSVIAFTDQTNTTGDGSFSFSYTIPESAALGIWNAAAAGGGNSSHAVFKVTTNDALTTIVISGSIPDLSVNGDGYDLSQLMVNGYDQNNNPIDLSGLPVTWQISPGTSEASLNGNMLTPGAVTGAGTVTATIGTITSQLLSFKVLEGCFIATAAYGSYLDPHVRVLRDFRDQCLLSFGLGRQLVSFYYNNSPPLAAYIAHHETMRTVSRWFLTPIVFAVEQWKAVLICLLIACVYCWQAKKLVSN